MQPVHLVIAVLVAFSLNLEIGAFSLDFSSFFAKYFPPPYKSLGCYKDAESWDSYYMSTRIKMTVKMCSDKCTENNKFMYFGLKAGSQCVCGSTFYKRGVSSDSECNSPCAGDKKSMCGGKYRRSIYKLNPLYKSLGCYEDKKYNRDLTGAISMHTREMTITKCSEYCAENKFIYFGLQNGYECYCGNEYGKHGKASGCSIRCSGNMFNICGGKYRNSMYKISPFYKSLGCYQDKYKQRDLTGATYMHTREMTVTTCSENCAKNKFKYFGLQDGYKCYCGNEYGKHGRAAAGSDCSIPCSGDKKFTCGGKDINSIYEITYG